MRTLAAFVGGGLMLVSTAIVASAAPAGFVTNRQFDTASSDLPLSLDAGVAEDASSLDSVVAHAAVVGLANRRGLVCTGALISPSVVMTARHCLPIAEVRFGSDARTPIRRVPVVAERRSPIEIADVALLRLETAQATPPPLRLRTEGEPPTGFVRLIGYGAIDAQGAVSLERRHFVDVHVRDWQCDGQGRIESGCIRDLEMTIPRSAGSDTCSGDSGGPVLEHGKDGFQVLAITSRALRSALLTCGDGGIYTRADRVARWARNVINEWEGTSR